MPRYDTIIPLGTPVVASQINRSFDTFSDGSFGMIFPVTGGKFAFACVSAAGVRTCLVNPIPSQGVASRYPWLYIDQYNVIWIILSNTTAPASIDLYRGVPNTDKTAVTWQWFNTKGTFPDFAGCAFGGVLYNPVTSDAYVLVGGATQAAVNAGAMIIKYTSATNTLGSAVTSLTHALAAANSNSNALVSTFTCAFDANNNVQMIFYAYNSPNYVPKSFVWANLGNFTWNTSTPTITTIGPTLSSLTQTVNGNQSITLTQGPNTGLTYAEFNGSYGYLCGANGVPVKTTQLNVGTISIGNRTVWRPTSDHRYFYCVGSAGSSLHLNVLDADGFTVRRLTIDTTTDLSWAPSGYTVSWVDITPGSDRNHVNILLQVNSGSSYSYSLFVDYVFNALDFNILDTLPKVPLQTMYVPSWDRLSNGDVVFATAYRATLTDVSTLAYTYEVTLLTTGGQIRTLTNKGLPSIPAGTRGKAYISVDDQDHIHVVVVSNVTAGDVVKYWHATIDAGHTTLTWRVSDFLVKSASSNLDLLRDWPNWGAFPRRIAAHTLPDGTWVCHVLLFHSRSISGTQTGNVFHQIVNVSATYVASVTSTTVATGTLTANITGDIGYIIFNKDTKQLRVRPNTSNGLPAALNSEKVANFNGVSAWTWDPTNYAVPSGAVLSTNPLGYSTTGQVTFIGSSQSQYRITSGTGGGAIAAATDKPLPLVSGGVTPAAHFTYDVDNTLQIAWHLDSTNLNTLYVGITNVSGDITLWGAQVQMQLDQQWFMMGGSSGLAPIMAKPGNSSQWNEWGAVNFYLIQPSLNKEPGAPVVTSPATNGIYTDSIPLTASSTDPDGDTVSLIWEYGTDGVNWTQIGSVGPANSGLSQTLTWNVSALPQGNYQVRVRAIDFYSSYSNYVIVNPISIGHMYTAAASITFSGTVNDVDTSISRLASAGVTMVGTLAVTDTQVILKGTGTATMSGTLTGTPSLTAAGLSPVVFTGTLAGTGHAILATGGSLPATLVVSNTQVLLTLRASAGVSMVGTLDSTTTSVTHPGQATAATTGTLSNSGTQVIHEGYADVMQVLTLLNLTPAAMYVSGTTMPTFGTAQANATQIYAGLAAVVMSLDAVSDKTEVVHPSGATVTMVGTLTGGSVLIGAGVIGMGGAFTTTASPVAIYQTNSTVTGTLTINIQELVLRLAQAAINMTGLITANSQVDRLAVSDPLFITGNVNANGNAIYASQSTVGGTLVVTNTQLVVIRNGTQNYVPNASLNDLNADGLPDGWTVTIPSITTTVTPSVSGPFNTLQVNFGQDLLAADGWPGVEGAEWPGIDMGNISGKPVNFRVRAKVNGFTSGQLAIWIHWWLSDNTSISADMGIANGGDGKSGSGWFDISVTRVPPTYGDGRYVKGLMYWRPGGRLTNGGTSLQVEQMQALMEEVMILTTSASSVVVYKGTGSASTSATVNSPSAKVQYAGQASTLSTLTINSPQTMILIPGGASVQGSLNVTNSALSVTWADSGTLIGAGVVSASSVIVVAAQGTLSAIAGLQGLGTYIIWDNPTVSFDSTAFASTFGAVERLNSVALSAGTLISGSATSELDGRSDTFATATVVANCQVIRNTGSTVSTTLTSVATATVTLAGQSTIGGTLNTTINQTVIRLNSATVSGALTTSASPVAELVDNSSITMIATVSATALAIKPSSTSVSGVATIAGSGTVTLKGQADTLITTLITADSYPVIIAAGVASANGFVTIQAVSQILSTGSVDVYMSAELTGRSTYLFYGYVQLDVITTLSGDPWKLDVGASGAADIVSGLTGDWERIRHAIGSLDGQVDLIVDASLENAGSSLVEMVADAQASIVGSLVTHGQGVGYAYLDIGAQGITEYAGDSSVFGSSISSALGLSEYAGAGNSNMVFNVTSWGSFISGSESDVTAFGTLIAQASIIYDGKGLLETALDMLAEALRMPLGEILVLIDSDLLVVAEVTVPRFGHTLTIVAEPAQDLAIKATGDRVLTLGIVKNSTLTLKVYVKED